MAAIVFGVRLAVLMFLFGIVLIACSTCGGGKMSIQDKYEQMLYTTVRIDYQGSGSGVVIDTNNYTVILTAAHVVRDAQRVRVRFYPSETEYVGEVTKISEEHDLAFVVVPNYEHKYVAKRGEPRELLVFEKTYKLGAALGHDYPLATEGIVSEVADYVFITSSPVVFGDSGGGIFMEEDGEYFLVGITVQISNAMGMFPVFHMGIALDMFALEEFLNE